MPSVPAASYPNSVWTGDSLNIDRQDRVNETNPNCQDWDRIVSELIATQTELDETKSNIEGDTLDTVELTSNTTLGNGSQLVLVSAATGNKVITLPAAADNTTI